MLFEEGCHYPSFHFRILRIASGYSPYANCLFLDQHYSCSADDVESIEVDSDGVFDLHARAMVGEAVEDGVVLDRRERGRCRVTFEPVEDADADALRAEFEG